MAFRIVQADCIEFLNGLEPESVDLCFFSPPYELARLYLENGEDMGIARDTEQWVAWMVEVFQACLRVCKGLVACVCEGQTRSYRYSCSPALLMADLHRAGVHLRKPPIFHRIGIPGSGGPDWLRNDYEFIVCATNGGKLPWSDNTAMGHPPKWAPGGEMSYRLTDGARVNQWGTYGESGNNRKKDGKRQTSGRPSHKLVTKKMYARNPDGTRDENEHYTPPVKANPGNVIERTYTTSEVAELMGELHDRIHLNVGGGLMGSELAHDNEAPFPDKLPEFFVLSFCPPGGLVCDPFSGSGTTAAVSVRHGRNFTGCDLRASQVELGLKRVANETPMMLFT